ncbi:MAG: hypothetical protein GF330_00330 [Candidatus Eisenbacteria bacterium]|nr:hypothetical protein [Candidatus Eisenbacteria bacterium]
MLELLVLTSLMLFGFLVLGVGLKLLGAVLGLVLWPLKIVAFGLFGAFFCALLAFTPMLAVLPVMLGTLIPFALLLLLPLILIGLLVKLIFCG